MNNFIKINVLFTNDTSRYYGIEQAQNLLEK